MEKEKITLSSKSYFYNVKNSIASKLSYLEHDLYEVCGVDPDRMREVIIEEILEAINSVDIFQEEESNNESNIGDQCD